MPISVKQISLRDVSSEFDNFMNSNNDSFLFTFKNAFNVSEYIPFSFYRAYYSKSGRKRKYSLEAFLNAFIIKNILNISSIDLLITILSISKELREFCGFDSVPDKSRFSRFKTDFYEEINLLFHSFVDHTEPLAYDTNPFLASILVTDTTGFEAYVTENNPKFYQSILKKVKTYAKKLPEDKKKTFDVEKYSGSLMPKTSNSNVDAKLTYLNGHFGYYIKTILSTNAFGLVRDINFYDNDNNLDCDLRPQEIKDKYDAKSLIPTLETFFAIHPNLTYKYFLGDSGFDADENYKYLYEERNIIPIINLNPRNASALPEPGLNSIGVPTCPSDPELPMKYDGIIREKGRSNRIKYLCPKSKKAKINGKTTYILSCDNPCTPSKCGRIKNLTVNHNYRFNTSMPRDEIKWSKLYKLRTVCERSIYQLKNFIQLNSSKVRNTISLKADILLAGISQIASFIILCHTKNQKTPLAIKSIIA
tara:strand:- start:135 stop:1565 length:1431 start_codon:yes stop_codon:yes gene_type:complete